MNHDGSGSQSTGRGLRILVTISALYLGGLGFLSGMVVERMRFDHQRDVVLRSLSDAEKELHARLIDIEKQAESERLSSDR